MELTHEYGSGYSQRYLAYFRKFYLTMPNLGILQTRLQNLKWSHILATLRVEDETARRWYLEAASVQMWDVRTLNRNISTQYYERHYVQPTLPSESAPIPPKEEILKTPMMAEFLGFKPDDSFSESDLEASIIAHLRDFMMELGRDLLSSPGNSTYALMPKTTLSTWCSTTWCSNAMSLWT